MSNTNSERSVPFFNYPHVYKAYEKDILPLMIDLHSRGAFILQNELKVFEQEFAQFAGAKYGLGLANGTDALIIALKLAGIKAGDEVIFCSHTMVATAAAIHFNGGIPVPVECGADHMIDPASVEAAITDKTRMIMPTQLNGRTCDMDQIMAIARKHNLLVVEDAAQALGSKFKGKAAGTFGLSGMISFFPAKSLGCYGDGGGLLTDDQDFYEAAIAMRDHGRNSKGEIVCWGLNSRLDNVQAAVLSYKLKTFPSEIERRRKVAAIYQEELGNLRQLDLPPAPNASENHYDTYQNYELEADRRDELVAYLRTRGIGTLIQWGGKAVHQFPSLNVKASLPYTERFFTRCVMLPMNTSISDQDVAYVCRAVKDFYR